MRSFAFLVASGLPFIWTICASANIYLGNEIEILSQAAANVTGKSNYWVQNSIPEYLNERGQWQNTEGLTNLGQSRHQLEYANALLKSEYFESIGIEKSTADKLRLYYRSLFSPGVTCKEALDHGTLAMRATRELFAKIAKHPETDFTKIGRPFEFDPTLALQILNEQFPIHFWRTDEPQIREVLIFEGGEDGFFSLSRYLVIFGKPPMSEFSALTTVPFTVLDFNGNPLQNGIAHAVKSTSVVPQWEVRLSNPFLTVAP